MSAQCSLLIKYSPYEHYLNSELAVELGESVFGMMDVSKHQDLRLPACDPITIHHKVRSAAGQEQQFVRYGCQIFL